MSEGFYKRRRGILEHIESGAIDLLESGIHDYLLLKANLLIGSDCSIPVGCVYTSAPAIHAHCKRVSERTIQRILEHLEAIGWIRTFREPNQRGNYPVLLCRASVHDRPGSCRETVTPNVNCCHPKCKTLSGREYRINADATTDWRHPVYEPVGQVSPETVNVVGELAGYREKRVESRDLKSIPPAKTAEAPPSGEFEVFWDSYPRKVDKQSAMRAWIKNFCEGHLEQILASLTAWKATSQWGDPKFIPYASTWLNKGRHKEIPVREVSSNANPGAVKPTAGKYDNLTTIRITA